MKKVYNFILSLLAVALICSCGNSGSSKSDKESYDSAIIEETGNESQKIDNNSMVERDDDEDVVKTSLVSNGMPTIVDFTATWCPPCRKMKPIFHKLASEFRGEINFVSIDIDENPELAEKYQVQAVPTFVFLDEEGNEGNRITGYVSEEELRNELLGGAWY